MKKGRPSAKFGRRSDKAISSIIGTMILFGMLASIALGYFYILSSDQQAYQQAVKQNNNQIVAQNSERLTVYGFSQNNQLAFYINNSGIGLSVVSYWITNGTAGPNVGKIAQYYNTTIPGSPLPFNINQGASITYNGTKISLTNPNVRYVIKVLTARGTTAIGTYPSQQLTSASVNALVAGGFGSLQMTFSSFNWYDYTAGPARSTTSSYTANNGTNYQLTSYNLCANGAQCNGGSDAFEVAHPHPGSLIPEGYITSDSCRYGTCNVNYNQIPIVISVNITNDDPGLGTIVLNSESNLWITETCDFGTTENTCTAGSPVYVFYIMNVNQTTGAILSQNQGSFAQVVLPYGVTKTIYYGSVGDLSLGSFTPIALSSFYGQSQQVSYYGEFAVFLLFSGTKVTTQSVQVYGQNIPFESAIAADNLGWYSEAPMTCTHSVQSSFTLTVNNSAFSFSTAKINKITLNASSFTINSVSSPGSWRGSYSNGLITWQSSTISPGASQQFTWKGTAPSSAGQQVVFPVIIYWSSGIITTMQAAAACTVN